MTTEIERIRHGPDKKESPNEMGAVRFVAKCSGNASEVLAIARESLEIAIRLADAGVFEEDVWVAALPGRFVGNSVPHPSQQEIDRELALPLEERINLQAEKKWSIRMFMNSFLPELDMRYWSWWDVAILDENQIVVIVEVKAWPFPWQSLRWLFKASGAIDLVSEPL